PMKRETQSDWIHRQWSLLFLIFTGQGVVRTAVRCADRISLPICTTDRPGSFAPLVLVHSHPANELLKHYAGWEVASLPGAKIAIWWPEAFCLMEK
ncbi:MAG: hypothetical protein ACTH8A_14700, partial [Serratia proteamaculans]